MTALNRLLDVLSLTSGDKRVQTVFTHDVERRSALSGGVEDALHALQVPFVRWDEAIRQRFDLVLAASENDQLAELDGPVLLMPHGAGHQKFYPGTSAVSGLKPGRLVMHGRVVPAAIALPHSSHLERLRAACPQAAPYGVVVGDPALARMRDSQVRSEQLRSALGARERRVVVIASTFGGESVFGRFPDLPEMLLAGLPADEYQVQVVLHPGVWAAHGPWQVRAWLARAEACGLHVVAPHEGWQAALLAASVVIADHGSLGLYAAVLGKPVILAGRASAVTVPGSAAEVLAARAPVWDPHRAPREQIDAVTDQPDQSTVDAVKDLLVEPSIDPTECARRLRTVMYRLMQLSEPAATPAFGPVVPAQTDANQVAA